jgi:hypothetical protein
VQKAVFTGVTVAEPLFACEEPAVCGRPFFIMRRADGIAAPDQVTGDRVVDPALPAVAERLGGEFPISKGSAHRGLISRSWRPIRKSARRQT